jgi:hypothetical protein
MIGLVFVLFMIGTMFLPVDHARWLVFRGMACVLFLMADEPSLFGLIGQWLVAFELFSLWLSIGSLPQRSW